MGGSPGTAPSLASSGGSLAIGVFGVYSRPNCPELPVIERSRAVSAVICLDSPTRVGGTSRQIFYSQTVFGWFRWSIGSARPIDGAGLEDNLPFQRAHRLFLVVDSYSTSVDTITITESCFQIEKSRRRFTARYARVAWRRFVCVSRGGIPKGITTICL